MKFIPAAVASISILFVIAVCLNGPSWCQESEPMDTLLLNGDDWVFHVREPKGWHGDTEDAQLVPANVVFLPDPQTDLVAKPLIYIQLTAKRSENMNKTLKEDIKQYKARIPEAQFRDFKAHHDKYAVSSKLYAVPGEFYEYIAFVNPGKSVRYQLAVVLRVQKREATQSELDAFQFVLSSINWYEGVVPIVPKQP